MENPTTPTELKRDLGARAAASIVVGTVIGSGIFLVPKTMILRAGTPNMVFIVWVVGGLLSLAGALSYAELAAALPEAGGEYAFLREAYGPMWGFLYSWTQMWSQRAGPSLPSPPDSLSICLISTRRSIPSSIPCPFRSGLTGGRSSCATASFSPSR